MITLHPQLPHEYRRKPGTPAAEHALAARESKRTVQIRCRLPPSVAETTRGSLSSQGAQRPAEHTPYNLQRTPSYQAYPQQQRRPKNTHKGGKERSPVTEHMRHAVGKSAPKASAFSVCPEKVAGRMDSPRSNVILPRQLHLDFCKVQLSENHSRLSGGTCLSSLAAI